MEPNGQSVDQLKARVEELEHLLAISRSREEALTRERKEFISIFNSLDAGIYAADPDTYELLFANSAIRKVAGNGEEILGKKCYRVLQNRSEPCPSCANPVIFGKKLGKPHVYEYQNRINGRWYHCIDRSIRWIDGRTVSFKVAVDIHDRKTAEEELQESERKYATLVEQAHDGVFIIQDGIRRFCNKAMGKILGYLHDEIIDQPYLDNVLPEYRDQVAKRLRDVQSQKEGPQIYQSKIVRKDGTVRDVEVSIAPIIYNRKAAIMGIMRDITDFRKMAETLWESEEKYRILHDYLDLHLPLHLGHSDETYKFKLWNRYSEKMLGYRPEEAIGKLSPLDIHETPEEAYEVVAVAERDGIYDRDINFVHRDGRKVPVHLVVVPKKNPEGEIIGLYGFAEDITERKKAEMALRESERRFRDLVENSLVGILICQEGRIIYNNPEHDRIFNFTCEYAPIERFEKRVHPDDVDKFKPFFEMCRGKKGAPLDTDVRFIVNKNLEKNTNVKWVQCRASKIIYQGKEAVLANMMDISRTKQLENILNVEDKMTSLGRIAAGMAHEIRSPLSGINILFDTLEQICENNERIDSYMLEEFRKIIAKVQQASLKIEYVVRRVLDFARPVEIQRTLASLNEPVEEAINLSKVTLRKEDIVVEKILDPKLPDCYVSSRLIEQVLLNLITNAIQAMNGMKRQKVLSVVSYREGRYAVVKVADSGVGVPESYKEKIFDPYFSTKSNGSGIGLSLSRRIIKDHEGILEVSRSRLGGAEFAIRIPVPITSISEELAAISFG